MKKGLGTMSIIMGVIMIIVGIVMCFMGNHLENFGAAFITDKKFYVDDAKFGADFYTYMYEASNTIVEELDVMTDEMNELMDGVETVSRNQTELAQIVAIGFGVVVCCLGVLAILLGAYCMNDDEKFEEKEMLSIMRDMSRNMSDFIANCSVNSEVKPKENEYADFFSAKNPNNQ
ncbi:MAG: hypothetical protein J6L69_08055 [Lachnospiraceae bacterium]|nr:hypothetical protein [Lachnospiraceae bacterium]